MLVRQSINDIAANGVTTSELSDYKLFQQKQFANNQRQNGYWAGLIENKIEWDIDSRTEYESILEKLSSDDIRNFVKDVVLPANNCITIIMLPDDFTEKEWCQLVNRQIGIDKPIYSSTKFVIVWKTEISIQFFRQFTFRHFTSSHLNRMK